MEAALDYEGVLVGWMRKPLGKVATIRDMLAMAVTTSRL